MLVLYCQRKQCFSPNRYWIVLRDEGFDFRCDVSSKFYHSINRYVVVLYLFIDLSTKEKVASLRQLRAVFSANERIKRGKDNPPPLVLLHRIVSYIIEYVLFQDGGSKSAADRERVERLTSNFLLLAERATSKVKNTDRQLRPEDLFDMETYRKHGETFIGDLACFFEDMVYDVLTDNQVKRQYFESLFMGCLKLTVKHKTDCGGLYEIRLTLLRYCYTFSKLFKLFIEKHEKAITDGTT